MLLRICLVVWNTSLRPPCYCWYLEFKVALDAWGQVVNVLVHYPEDPSSTLAESLNNLCQKRQGRWFGAIFLVCGGGWGRKAIVCLAASPAIFFPMRCRFPEDRKKAASDFSDVRNLWNFVRSKSFAFNQLKFFLVPILTRMSPTPTPTPTPTPNRR